MPAASMINLLQLQKCFSAYSFLEMVIHEVLKRETNQDNLVWSGNDNEQKRRRVYKKLVEMVVFLTAF